MFFLLGIICFIILIVLFFINLPTSLLILGVVMLIGLPIYMQEKKKPQNKKTHNNNVFDYSENDAFNENYRQTQKIHSEYENIINRHQDLIEQIGQLYTVINNIGDIHGKEMDKCIDMCHEDINLAPSFFEYEKKIATLNNYEITQLHFESFKRLAIIYEKQGEYELAIQVCDYALSLGLSNDGTTGGIIGRKARLLKKSSKASNSN